MIKTIIFDLSEVYLQGLLGTHEKLTARLGKYVDAEDLRIPELQDFFNGKTPEEHYWQSVIDRYGWNIGIDELKKIVRSNFSEIEGTRKILEELKADGYTLGLLSVHTREWVDHCEKEFDYHKLFDSVVYSFEIAACKPEREAYEHILKKLSAKPEECLFIDDSPENLLAAEELGIKTALFTSSERLRNDLNGLGINIGK